MDPTVLKIMIHGLIALASKDATDPNHITALLLDARMPLECVGAHLPELSFPVAAEHEGQCKAAGCVVIGSECVCTKSLARKDVWIQFEAPPNELSSPAATAPTPETTSVVEDDTLANNRGIPPDRDSAGDMVYVANLTKPPFDSKLNPEYLEDQPKVTNLFARMKINATKLTACSLSKREDQGEMHVLPMDFRRLDAKGTKGDRSQALAQMVMASINIQEGKQVKLYISDFGDVGGPSEKSIVVAHGEHGYMIDLSNATTGLTRGDPCDDGKARHFSHFYEFAEKPPGWPERLIPHIRFVQGVRAADLELQECQDPTFELHDRPICPIASFLP